MTTEKVLATWEQAMKEYTVIHLVVAPDLHTAMEYQGWAHLQHEHVQIVDNLAQARGMRIDALTRIHWVDIKRADLTLKQAVEEMAALAGLPLSTLFAANVVSTPTGFIDLVPAAVPRPAT